MGLAFQRVIEPPVSFLRMPSCSYWGRNDRRFTPNRQIALPDEIGTSGAPTLQVSTRQDSGNFRIRARFSELILKIAGHQPINEAICLRSTARESLCWIKSFYLVRMLRHIRNQDDTERRLRNQPRYFETCQA